MRQACCALQARIASLVSERGGAEDMPLLEALEDPAEAPPPPASEPTMMSREARALMLSGQGQAGLQLWKVRTPMKCRLHKPGM